MKLETLEIPQILQKDFIVEDNWVYSLKDIEGHQCNAFWAAFESQRGGCTDEEVKQLAEAAGAIPEMVMMLSLLYENCDLPDTDFRRRLADLLVRVGVKSV